MDLITMRFARIDITRTLISEQILKYQTRRKYRGFDNFDDPFPLLKYERASILQKLGAR